jgi:acyl-CoA reductase-like NAD-dependent aldehyde dehydrogenase
VIDTPTNQNSGPPAAEASRAPVAGASLVPISPTDLRPHEPVPISSEPEIRAAVARARVAQEGWRHWPVGKRIAALKRAAKGMLRRRAEVIESARLEMGKVEVEGLFNEALGPLETINGWAKLVRGSMKPRTVRLNPLSFPKKRAQVDQVPRGVVGIIAPWNYPVSGLYRSTIPALMTGNAVVLKPSEYTPRTSAWLVASLAAELPEDLIQVVQGAGAVGTALIDSGIDACVFTGSPGSGRKVRLRCAERGIPCSIEMGGKDPAIVLADCDLPRTVAGITHWALSNAGQACGAVEIAYVDESIADEFVERLRRAWTKIRAAPGEFVEVGPLANRRQLEVVVAQVEDARAKGAQVVCGGGPAGPGLWYPATVLDRCDARMSVVSDETFGPVLAVVRVQGAAEAIQAANQGRYGLGASIWTSDLDRARRLAERLEVGIVTINNHAFSGAIPALPWSGLRETGFGVANGIESLPTFVRPRTLVVDSSRSRDPFWMPYDRSLWDMGQILAELQLGQLARAWRLPFLWRKRVKAIRAFFS